MKYVVTLHFNNNTKLPVEVEVDELDNFLEDLWKTGRYYRTDQNQGFACNTNKVIYASFEKVATPEIEEASTSIDSAIKEKKESLKDEEVKVRKKPGPRPGAKRRKNSSRKVKA